MDLTLAGRDSMKRCTSNGRYRRTFSTPTLAPSRFRYSTVSSAVSPPEPIMISTRSAFGSPTYWNGLYWRPGRGANWSIALAGDGIKIQLGHLVGAGQWLVHSGLQLDDELVALILERAGKNRGREGQRRIDQVRSRPGEGDLHIRHAAAGGHGERQAAGLARRQRDGSQSEFEVIAHRDEQGFRNAQR